MRRDLLDDDGQAARVDAEVIAHALAERRERCGSLVGPLVQAAHELMELGEEGVVVGGHPLNLGSMTAPGLALRHGRPVGAVPGSRERPPRHAPAVSQAERRMRQPSVPSRASMYTPKKQAASQARPSAPVGWAIQTATSAGTYGTRLRPPAIAR